MQDYSCFVSQQCCRGSAYYTDVFSNVNTYLQNKYKHCKLTTNIAILSCKHAL